MTRDDVLQYPHQIGDALWRIEAAGVPTGVVEVCGAEYGAGELAAAIVGDRAAAMPEALVLCASYSGDDEEALACLEEAGRRDARRVVVTTGGALAARAREERVPVIGVPGGFGDPRAAIIYFTVAAVILANPSLRSELEAAVPALRRLAEAQEADLETPSERVLGERLLRDLAAAQAQ
jgi:glucose/mannose-6-phosphate isomerase